MTNSTFTITDLYNKTYNNYDLTFEGGKEAFKKFNYYTESMLLELIETSKVINYEVQFDGAIKEKQMIIDKTRLFEGLEQIEIKALVGYEEHRVAYNKYEFVGTKEREEGKKLFTPIIENVYILDNDILQANIKKLNAEWESKAISLEEVSELEIVKSYNEKQTQILAEKEQNIKNIKDKIAKEQAERETKEISFFESAYLSKLDFKKVSTINSVVKYVSEKTGYGFTNYDEIKTLTSENKIKLSKFWATYFGCEQILSKDSFVEILKNR
jgi:hypothetical protein